MGFLNLFFKKPTEREKLLQAFDEGNAKMDAKDFEGAVVSYSKMIEIVEQTNLEPDVKQEFKSLIFSKRSQAFEGLERFNEAEIDLLKTIDFNPEDELVLNHFGILKMKQNQFVEAIKYFERTLKINPNNADAYFHIGFCLAQENKDEQSIEYFSKSLELEPNDEEALYNIGFSYQNLKNFEKAIGFYSKTLEVDANYASAFVNRGNCKIELGLKQEACLDYHRALELGEDRVLENIDQYCKS